MVRAGGDERERERIREVMDIRKFFGGGGGAGVKKKKKKEEEEGKGKGEEEGGGKRGKENGAVGHGRQEERMKKKDDRVVVVDLVNDRENDDMLCTTGRDTTREKEQKKNTTEADAAMKKKKTTLTSTTRSPHDAHAPSTDTPEQNTPPAPQPKQKAEKSSTPTKRKASASASASPAKATTNKSKFPVLAPEDVRAAVAAAAATLPTIDPTTLTMHRPDGDNAGGFNSGADVLPPRRGSVTYPTGHELALAGYIFARTGLLDTLTREEMRDFVQKHGGKVTESVSSKTSFLIVGGSDCGNSKLEKAAEFKTKLINEEGLIALVRATVDFVRTPPAAPKPTNTASNATGAQAMHVSKTDAHAARAGKQSVAVSSSSSGELWTEKYRPKHPDELVGHGTTARVLAHWLKEWHNVHLNGATPTPAPGGGVRAHGKVEKPKKAVLLCGSPGLGKTSMALITCKSLGFAVVEINASDTRNQAEKDVNKGMNGRLANVIKEMVTNTTLGGNASGGGGRGYAHGGASTSTGAGGRPAATVGAGRKPVLIMDEVDGLAGNQDRGGVADLIKTIQDSRVPIICICNDKYSQKIKSLRNHCMELDFRKPTAMAVRARLMKICETEGLQIQPAVLEKLAEGCNCDIRLAINNLQMITRHTKSVGFDTMKKSLDQSAKDLAMSPFVAAGKLFEISSGALSLNNLQELAFADSDLVPLLVQENYLNYVPQGCTKDVERLYRMAKAADSVSNADVTNRLVRLEQKWGLMPLANILGCVYPARLVSGSRTVFNLHPGENNFTRFTAFLGNLSSSNKQKRVLSELHGHMLASEGSYRTADRTSLRLSYLNCMKRILTKPLVDEAKEVRATKVCLCMCETGVVQGLLQYADVRTAYCVYMCICVREKERERERERRHTVMTPFTPDFLSRCVYDVLLMIKSKLHTL